MRKFLMAVLIVTLAIGGYYYKRSYRSGETMDIWNISFSHDGRSLAVSGGWNSEFSKGSGAVFFRDALSGRTKYKTQYLERNIYWGAFSPNDKSFSAWEEDGGYTMWDVNDMRVLQEGDTGTVRIIPIVAVRNWLSFDAMKSLDNELLLKNFIDNNHMIGIVGVSVEKKLIAVVNSKYFVKVYKLSEKGSEVVCSFDCGGAIPQKFAFSSQGDKLALICNLPDRGWHCIIASASSGDYLAKIKLSQKTPHVIAISDDGKKIAVEYYDKNVEVRSVHSGKILLSFNLKS